VDCYIAQPIRHTARLKPIFFSSPISLLFLILFLSFFFARFYGRVRANFEESVEGSTIIIAACIPVLQPLADKLTGGRFFSSKTRRNYKHYGSERSGARVGQSDVELSYHGRKRQVKDPNALTFLDQTKVGSEESILGDKENQVQESSKQRRQSLQPGVNIVPGRITRTDVIEVSHSSGSQQTLHGIPEQGRRHV